MAGMSIMVGVGSRTEQICTSSSQSPYPIERVGYSPYTYLYPVNVEIFHLNENVFGQYLEGQVYFPSLPLNIKTLKGRERENDS